MLGGGPAAPIAASQIATGVLPPCPPSPSGGRDLPRARVPSRVVLAFVPGIELQVPAAAAALGPLRPLPCTLGLGPALQLQAGLLLPTGQTTHTGPLPTAPPPARLPGPPRGGQRPALRRPSPCTAFHPQPAAFGDLDSPGRCLSWPQPLDKQGFQQLATILEESARLSPVMGPRPSLPKRHLLFLLGVTTRSQGCLAAKSSHSLSPADLLVSPRIQFSSECAAFS